MDVYTLEPLLSLPESLLDSSLPLKGKQQAMVILQERQLQEAWARQLGKASGDPGTLQQLPESSPDTCLHSSKRGPAKVNILGCHSSPPPSDLPPPIRCHRKPCFCMKTGGHTQLSVSQQTVTYIKFMPKENIGFYLGYL